MSHKPSIDYVFRHQHKPKKTPLMCQSSRRFPSDHTGRTSSRCVCPSGRWYNLPEFKINVIFFFFLFLFFVECNLICFPSVALCRCRSSHRLHRRARSQELPPEETPQTQVQPQGQAGTSRARHGGIQVGRGDRRWSRHERPQATQWVLMKCMRESITFVIWNQLGDVQRQFVNHSSRDVSVLSVKDVVTQSERGGLGGVGS